ncbi:hypothetical protein ACFV1W_30300 [Kitasatospora sp. NPDC059648]|uniref:hypothetical protein n=1 Tax=Kitasatospora sp. NPDC059648 TaxID=3346894 RepID=UPI003677B93E
MTTLTFSAGEPVPWDAPRSWRCHQCGATGTDVAGTDGADAVLADGVTYLQPHCPACLPQPATEERPAGWRFGDPRPPEWVEYRAESMARGRALVDAVRQRVVDGTLLDLYRCSVCGGAWSIGPRVVLPCGVLYDRSTDLFEHPCTRCVNKLTSEELAAAHFKRSREL